ASKETWVKAVLPWRTWMRNQWIMAAGVKRQLSHHEWPAWRQAWWMKSQPSLAARSCLRVLRVVEIRRCIAGPPGPWWVRKIPLCTGVPLFSRDEAAWGYRCLNAIRDVLNCCGKMHSLRRAGLPGSFNLPKQLRMSPSRRASTTPGVSFPRSEARDPEQDRQVLTRQTWSELVMSLTAANRSCDGEVATPTAPPWAALSENWPTNLPLPLRVNSTSSLGWVGSELIASPLAVMKLPSGARARPSGPWRWVAS